ncbi:hypothetical protein GCM10023328_41040 [Modestobacter marinus]|uniref:Uncharacterized protein n=1 Tax=Modestobacter marinus TaxID=477641 RepID=A0ABQ2FVH3_9ACTN|nr:hypothetical protein GCM10011589_13150 [Modestobacter marinus]
MRVFRSSMGAPATGGPAAVEVAVPAAVDAATGSMRVLQVRAGRASDADRPRLRRRSQGACARK